MSLELTLLLTGAFAMAFATGAAGFGDALVANAFWLHVLTPTQSLPLIVSCGVVVSVVSLWRLRGRLDTSKLWPFVAGGILGVPVGTWLLGYVEPEPFRLTVGVFLSCYAVLFLVLRRLPAIAHGGRGADSAVGFGGGILGGVAGLSGVLPTLWCGLRGWPKETQRGTFQPFILAMHALALVSAAVGGYVTMETAERFAMCLPALLAGTLVGVSLYHRLDERRFRDLVLCILLASGVALIATTA